MDFVSLFLKRTSLSFSKLDKFQSRISNYFNNFEIEKEDIDEKYEKVPVKKDINICSKKSLIETVYERRTTRDYSCSDMINIDELIYIIGNSFGNLSKNNDNSMFNYPSAGALYNCFVYLLIDKVEGMRKGIYLYNHIENTFSIVNEEDSYTYLPYISINANDLKKSGFIIYVTINLEKYIKKYGDRGIKFGLIEAGQLSQNLLLFSTELNFRTFTNGGYLDDKVNLLLTSNESEFVIANQIAVYK